MAGSSNIGDKDSSSAMFHDLEALECPICCDALTSPILHCDNGHLVCFTCCNKLMNKCPSCTLPIGHIRCRAMERVIRGVSVPCPNVKLGCTKSFSYGKDLSVHDHEKECIIFTCYCPWMNCDYTGSYKDLYTHFDIHIGESESESNRRHTYEFVGKSAEISFEFPKYTSLVMKEDKYSLLFIVQCFIESYGVCVTVSCIAPCAMEVGEFSCYISTLGNYKTMSEFIKVKKIRELSFETPKEEFMLIPYYVLCGLPSLKLTVCVSKVA